MNRLHETIADMAYTAATHGYHTADSREGIANIIYHAAQFERARHVDGDGNESYPVAPGHAQHDDYLIAVDSYIIAALELGEVVI